MERILELIHEAYDLHVNTFDVIGGEFFLYKHWREVLKELRKYGYNPYLSTKKPLSEDDVKFLAELKIHDIQISLDSLIEEHLIQSLGVKTGYINNMLDTMSLLDKYNIPVMVHSVLTKYNSNIVDMKSIYDALRKFRCVVDWHVVKGDPSLYPKVDYAKIEIAPMDLNNIIDYLSSLKNETDMPIHIPERAYIGTVDLNTNNANSRINQFFKRSFCSGLFSSLYILPDGKVTMCEQLYWNKDFIVGNVLSDSIMDIWNSEKAKSIYFIKQENIPNDSFVLGHIGRFSKVKNQSFLVDIFANVLKRNKKAFLLMIGNGSDKDRIVSELEKSGMKNRYLILSNRVEWWQDVY